MPEFILRVGTPEGDVVERPVVAASLRAAQDEMRRQGLHVFGSRRGSFRLRDFIPRFGRRRQHRALPPLQPGAARAGPRRPADRPVVRHHARAAEEPPLPGDPRRDPGEAHLRRRAFRRLCLLRRPFPPIYSTSLRAGERSGDLEGVIKRFLRYQKLIVNLRKSVVGAMIYPAILVLLSSAHDLRDDDLRHPEFAEFFEGFGQSCRGSRS